MTYPITSNQMIVEWNKMVAEDDPFVDEALALAIEIGRAGQDGKLGVTWPLAHAALVAAYRRGYERANPAIELVAARRRGVEDVARWFERDGWRTVPKIIRAYILAPSKEES